MRSKLSIVFPLVVLTVATGVLLATSASGQTVLHVVARAQNTKLIDIHGNGLRLGDRAASRGPLLDESQTERLGTAYLNCDVHRQIVGAHRGLWNCNYVLELADGDIVLQGLDPRGSGVYEMAVLGGTGAYAGAAGDATFTDVGRGGEEYTDMVIRLSG